MSSKEKTLGDCYGIENTVLGFKVGIELEIENIDFLLKDSYLYWSVINDGSLRGMSREFISKTPTSVEILPEAINELPFNDMLRYSSHRTSMHVHINCMDLTFKQLAFLIGISYILDPIITDTISPNRKHTNFCKPTCYNVNIARLVSGSFSNQGYGTKYKIIKEIANTRYLSVNLYNLVYSKRGHPKHTIEYRSFALPEHKDYIIDTVNTLHNLYTYAIEVSDDFDKFSDYLNSIKKYYQDFLYAVFNNILAIEVFNRNPKDYISILNRLLFSCYYYDNAINAKPPKKYRSTQRHTLMQDFQTNANPIEPTDEDLDDIENDEPELDDDF